MINLIVFLLLSYSFVVLTKLDGPFNLILRFREKLYQLPCGGFFFKLLQCSYCTGFWAGMLSYLICFNVSLWIFPLALVAAVFSYVVEILLSSLV